MSETPPEPTPADPALLAALNGIATAAGAVAERPSDAPDLSGLSDALGGIASAMAVLADIAGSQRSIAADTRRIADRLDAMQSAYEPLLTRSTEALERIGVSNQGQWDCCRWGSYRAEILLETTMIQWRATPPERWHHYQQALNGLGGLGGLADAGGRAVG